MTNATNKQINKKINPAPFFRRVLAHAKKNIMLLTHAASLRSQGLRPKGRGVLKRCWINKFKIILHSGLIGLLGYLFIGLFLTTASGQIMSNKDYTIKTEGLDVISGVIGSTNYKLRSTVGELSPIVPKIVSALPFSISLSSDLVDFGSLSPTNPIIRTVDLNVYSLSLYGYSVILFEDHPLKMNPPAGGANIPDTTCDNGECNEENASLWTNTLTYGIGYRCDNVVGFDCDLSFHNSNFYKSFADNSNSKSPQFVMTGIGSKNKSARLSYKVNISGTQQQGNYLNTITYIAIPNF